MTQLALTGRVIPERGVIEYVGAPSIEVIVSGARKLSIDIQIIKSQITATIFVDSGWFSYEEIGNIFEGVARIFVDSIGYDRGCGFDIEILTLMNLKTKERVVFGVNKDNVDQINFPKSIDVPEVSRLAFSNHQFRRALGDLRECIRSHEDVAFFSYRAIETVKQDFRRSEKESDKDIWPRMRQALNLSEEWLKEISYLSHRPRHGRVDIVDTECRALLIRRAWVVVDRFGVYLKGNRKQLDHVNFPMLYPIGILL